MIRNAASALSRTKRNPTKLNAKAERFATAVAEARGETLRLSGG